MAIPKYAKRDFLIFKGDLRMNFSTMKIIGKLKRTISRNISCEIATIKNKQTKTTLLRTDKGFFVI